MFKVGNVLKRSFILILVLLFFTVDAYANEITKIEKVIEIKEMTPEQFKKLHILWDFDKKQVLTVFP